MTEPNVDQDVLEIQLLKLRDNRGMCFAFTPKEREEFRVFTVRELFEKHQTIVEKLDSRERWNIYYTLAECQPDPKTPRYSQRQKVIGFDIDDCQINDDGVVNPDYIRVVTQALCIPESAPAIVFSGHGLQFIIELDAYIESSQNFFEASRSAYNTYCTKIDDALAAAGLPGHADTAIWDLRRPFRFPGTENRKPDKPVRTACLLQPFGDPIPFDLPLRDSPNSGASKDSESSRPDLSEEEWLGKTDSKAVEAGCGFLKHCKENQAAVSEQAWYALLSIVGRLENGRTLIHEYSKEHPKYQPEETEKKFEQALARSGPRTCKNIDTLDGWDGCSRCPHFGKVKSPICIKGDDWIGTKDSGFHHIVLDDNGKPKLRPDYEGLWRFFDQQKLYKLRSDSKTVFTWNGKKFEVFNKTRIENFAETCFIPKPDSKKVKEFYDKVCRKNLVPEGFFSPERNQGKINLNNGIFNFESGELTPHNPESGFLYVLPYDYDPGAGCPNFTKMLQKITCNDTATQTILLEYMGYCLSGDKPWAQKFLLLTGSGSNGKSTFLDILIALLGRENVSAVSMKHLSKQTEVQGMEGKLANIRDEIPKGALMDTEAFKMLVTGGWMRAKKMYKDTYDIQTYLKLVFSCNDLPESNDDTDAFFRRFIIVKFQAFFSKEDPDFDPFIVEKCLKELPGIFNLALQAYQPTRALKRFSISEKVQDNLLEYRQMIDHTTTWLEENLVVTKPLPLGDEEIRKLPFILFDELFSDFKTAAEQGGFRYGDRVQFSRKLRQFLPDLEARSNRKMVGTSKRTVVHGIKK